MGRQERRRRMRQAEPRFRWDMVAVYAVLAFFVATAAYSYFFPQINARAYARGPRIQRIIINRALDNIARKQSLEFTYSFSAATSDDTVQYQVKEDGAKVALTATENKETKEYSANEVPADYRTVAATVADIRAALKDKNYKIIYPEGENTYYSLRVVNQSSTSDVEGYDLYFTAEHALDLVHYYKTLGEDKVTQRIYHGLTTGIAEQNREEPNTP